MPVASHFSGENALGYFIGDRKVIGWLRQSGLEIKNELTFRIGLCILGIPAKNLPKNCKTKQKSVYENRTSPIRFRHFR